MDRDQDPGVGLLIPVLIGHGSPDPRARAEMVELRDLVAARVGGEVGLGVLEFPSAETPPIADVLDRARGRALAVQPLLLFDGLHGRVDLPAVVRRAEGMGVRVRMGGAFGSDATLIGLAAGRVATAGASRGDLLVVAGRGSSDPVARAQAARVAAAIARRTGLEHRLCFTGISRPTLEEGFANAMAAGVRRVVVLPYLLHGGVLVRRVADVFGGPAGCPVDTLPHLGNAPEVVTVIAQRLSALAPVPGPVPPPLQSLSRSAR